MRANIAFSLRCSQCGEELEADSERSKMLFGSAYDATAAMAIKPCKNCFDKANEPVRLIKKALSMGDSQSIT